MILVYCKSQVRWFGAGFILFYVFSFLFRLEFQLKMQNKFTSFNKRFSSTKWSGAFKKKNFSTATHWWWWLLIGKEVFFRWLSLARSLAYSLNFPFFRSSNLSAACTVYLLFILQNRLLLMCVHARSYTVIENHISKIIRKANRLKD